MTTLRCRDQAEADAGIPGFLRENPSGNFIIDCRDMRGPIDFHKVPGFNKAGAAGMDIVRRIQCVIVSGETGPDARPLHPQWVRSLRDQCQSAGVEFAFLGWGEWAPGNNGPGWDLYPVDRVGIESGFFDYAERWNECGSNPMRQTMDRLGARSGRLLDGVEWPMPAGVDVAVREGGE